VLVLQNVCRTITSVLFFMFAASLQYTLALWYSACITMTNGGKGIVPPM
jgi:hypothetical protein